MPAVAGACTPKLNKALKIQKKARIKQIIKRKIPVATMTSVPDHKCNTVKGATATSLYPISCQTAGSSRKREEMSVTPSSSRVNNLTQVKNKRKTIRFHCRRVMNRASPLMRACPEKDVDELAGVGQPIAQYKHTHTRGKSRTLQLRIAAAQEGKRSMKCYSKKGSFSPSYFVLAPGKDCSIWCREEARKRRTGAAKLAPLFKCPVPRPDENSASPPRGKIYGTAEQHRNRGEQSRNATR